MLETGEPRLNPEGKLLGFIGAAIDITPLKPAEAERIKLYIATGTRFPNSSRNQRAVLSIPEGGDSANGLERPIRWDSRLHK
jgi:hypothetical protein